MITVRIEYKNGTVEEIKISEDSMAHFTDLPARDKSVASVAFLR